MKSSKKRRIKERTYDVVCRWVLDPRDRDMGTGNPLPKFDPARDFPHTQIVPYFYELFHIRIPHATNSLKTYTVRIHVGLQLPNMVLERSCIKWQKTVPSLEHPKTR